MANDLTKMHRSLERFNREVKAYAAKIPGKVTVLQKKLVLEALRRIVQKTPVDTGRARGNWQVTIGGPASGVLERLDKDGSETIQKGLAAVASLPDFQVVWISNNLEYIEFLESGSSKQAPKGMVRLTILQLREMVRSGIKELKL